MRPIAWSKRNPDVRLGCSLTRPNLLVDHDVTDSKDQHGLNAQFIMLGSDKDNWCHVTRGRAPEPDRHPGARALRHLLGTIGDRAE